jgi:hypothetical protein
MFFKKNKNKIKTTLKFCLTPVKMSIIKKTTLNDGKDAGWKRDPYTLLLEM